MPEETPITLWIEELRAADEEAAAKLWNHFIGHLHESARHQIRPETRPVYDEEDAALSAFNSVCRGIVEGRFPDLRDRESLWKLMLVITSNKIRDRHRHDQQQRRDVRRTLTDSIFGNSAENSAVGGIHQLPAREPTPEFAAAFAETCEHLFQDLDDPRLREVAVLRMEGYADHEIASRLNCTRSTVQGRLAVIRHQWQHLVDSVERSGPTGHPFQ